MKSTLIKLFKKEKIALKIFTIAAGLIKMECSKFDENSLENSGISLFLCGDVMLGRGIDQILPNPSKPILYESYVRDAKDYVRLAEKKNGPLPKRPVEFTYPWGDALDVLDEMRPNVRIINLETSVTYSDEKWPDKGIHYRMNPQNVDCLKSANLDCCILANNHVLDWGHSGLEETLSVLERNGIRKCGAGLTRDEAAKPAIIELGGNRRVLIFGYGDESSGIPPEWAATGNRSGVNFLNNGLSVGSAQMIVEQIGKEKRPNGGDIVVLSIHWGGNWGFDVSSRQRKFAHYLIDSGLVDLVHGHSSHHVKGIEIYHGKLIIYGCGDFINDYEGISGHEEFRDNFCLMYFPLLDSKNGNLIKLEAIPMEVKQMQVKRASEEAMGWLFETMKRECYKNGVNVVMSHKNRIKFIW